MFNNGLKKEALRIHEETLNSYNKSYEEMEKSCEQLYEIRSKSVELIKLIQRVVNSIANTPKEFDTELGKIGRELSKFNETEEYAKEAYNASVKAGANIVEGAAAGLGVASMVPSALMSIATTLELRQLEQRLVLFQELLHKKLQWPGLEEHLPDLLLKKVQVWQLVRHFWLWRDLLDGELLLHRQEFP